MVDSNLCSRSPVYNVDSLIGNDRLYSEIQKKLPQDLYMRIPV